MELTKRQWTPVEYTQVFVDAYKRRGEFEPIVVHHLGKDYEIQFKQHPRILYWDEGLYRPSFVNSALVSVAQWLYFCAMTGYDVPTPVEYPSGNPMEYPVSYVSAIDVCHYLNWMNSEYGLPIPYEVDGSSIKQLHDGAAFMLPNAKEQAMILDRLPEMTDDQLSAYCWHRKNSGGQMQPLFTEPNRYFSKYQIGTLYPDGTFTNTSIGQSGPAGNLYWIAAQEERYEY